MTNLIEYLKKSDLLPASSVRTLCSDFGAMARELEKIYTRAPAKYRRPLKLSLTGGKYLRPMLAWASSQVVPDVRQFDLSRIMTILELTHSASLIHDDVVDGGLMRRRRPTALKLLGPEDAVRCGDYLMGRILDLLNGDFPRYIGLTLADTVSEMCIGELAQREYAFKPRSQTISSYYEQIDRKTANLISVCCLSGGIVCGLGDGELKQLTDFGLYLGRAFQISDDILDFIPPKKMEKARGQDIRGGIITLPMLCALEQAPSEDILSLLEKRDKSPEEIDLLIGFVLENGGTALAKRELDTYCIKAVDVLDGLQNTEILKFIIESLSETLLGRSDDAYIKPQLTR